MDKGWKNWRCTFKYYDDKMTLNRYVPHKMLIEYDDDDVSNEIMPVAGIENDAGFGKKYAIFICVPLFIQSVLVGNIPHNI